MTKRTPAPSTDAIVAAYAAAAKGKGRRLAELVKSFSTDDLAAAFGHCVPREPFDCAGLGNVLSFAAGLKQQRAECAAFGRKLRKARR